MFLIKLYSLKSSTFFKRLGSPGFYKGQHWTVRRYLWFHIQHGDLPLLMDLVDSFDLGSKHVALVTAVLKQLIPDDTFGHLIVGNEIIFLAVLLVLLWRSGGV